MSLLTDLHMAYETLADDPIEQGIRYGHSILDSLTTIVTPRLPEPVVETASAYSYTMPITREIVEQTVVPTSSQTIAPTGLRSRMIRNSSNYSPRVFKSRSEQSYTRRSMVGTM